MSQGQIVSHHFYLLRQFGKNPMQKNADPQTREQLWMMCCQGANVPYVVHAQVVEEWKRFIAANAQYSGLAVNGDVNPQFLSIAVTYKKRMVAAHTTKTESLLKRILQIYSKTFKTPDEFLEKMEVMCRETVGRGAKAEPES